MGKEREALATYLFPAVLLLSCLFLAALNLIIPHIISMLIITFGAFAAWAIVKVNEG